MERYLDAGAQEEIRANHAQACRELHERFVEMARRRGEIDAAEADAIIEAIEMSVWVEYGITTLTAYLEHVMGYGPRLALERERVARALRELPTMYESLKHGLPWSKVRELTRVATPETENAWLDAAQDMNVRQIEGLVRGHEKGDLPTDPTKPELAKRPVMIEMTEETYALFRQWKATLSDECGELLDDEQVIAISCQRGLAGSGAASPERPAAQVSYTVCRNCRATTADGAGIVVDVSPGSRDRALCDAEHLGDLDAASPERVTTTVTPRMRRQVLARDHGTCTVPGCRSTFALQLHHIDHQEDGGTHHLHNLISLCYLHHDLHHHKKLAIRRTPTGIEFHRILDHGDRVLDLGTYDLTDGTEPNSYPRGYESNSHSHLDMTRTDN
ncbi:MAG: HNH endonuclease [Deltaproteobacteria bacterium]|nr:HNH endonuclease [Deltaproteobacteria bacterium]